MTTVNIHEAKTHLSRLIESVRSGETVIIAKAGRPVARITAIDATDAPRRVGFLAGLAEVPDDFDDLGATRITAAFRGDPDAVAHRTSASDVA